MMARDFLPNSPTLTGAGRDMCLSACFVLPIEDSLDSIFETVKNAALVHKEGGGTGFDFSRLRPRGSFVQQDPGRRLRPGVVPPVIDAATEAVKQGGTRRGANMGILRVDHPDIEEFIQMKLGRQERRATSTSRSPPRTPSWTPSRRAAPYEHLRPATRKKVAGRQDARQGLPAHRRIGLGRGRPRPDLHRPGQPEQPDGGPRPHPCHEPLRRAAPPRLRVLQPRVRSTSPTSSTPSQEDSFDWEQVRPDDPARRPLPRRRHRGQPLPAAPDRGRRRGQPPDRARGHGLGRPPLPDEDPLRLAESPGPGREARRLPAQGGRGRVGGLAGERGSFPNIGRSVYKGRKMRNATVFTIAPTGTISRIAGCSSSIEPVFAFEFVSRSSIPSSRTSTRSTGNGRRKNPDKPLPEYFLTAHEISPEWHVRTQAAFQKHVDNSVSKTINFPHEATVEDVEKAYPPGLRPGDQGHHDLPRRHAGRARSSTRNGDRDRAPAGAGRPRCPPSPTRSRRASATST